MPPTTATADGGGASPPALVDAPPWGSASTGPSDWTDAGTSDAGASDAGTPDGGLASGTYPACAAAADGTYDAQLDSWGFVDVTALGADPTGATDSTNAIQAAIDRARDQKKVVFFPEGTYAVSRTITCAVDGQGSGESDGQTCVLMGSRSGARPRILLLSSSPGFGGGISPASCTHNQKKIVVHFYSWDPDPAGNDPWCGDTTLGACGPVPSPTSGKSPCCEKSNSAYNLKLINLEVKIGANNPCAVAVYLRGAQGTGAQDVSIDLTESGHTGLMGAAGSGGAHVGVRVEGGEIGLDFSEGQTGPTVVASTLVGQRQAALLYGGPQALSAVGLDIRSAVGAGPLVQTPPAGVPAANGPISLVDSRVESGRAGDPVIQSSRSVYLQNVHVRGATKLVCSSSGVNCIASPSSEWVRVRRLARPGIDNTAQGSSYEYPVYVAGAVQAGDLVDLVAGQAPPSDLQSRHVWPESSSCWEHEDHVPVSPSSSSTGYACDDPDPTVDDRADELQAAIDSSPGKVIFLRRGVYCLSRPIRLRGDTTLVGVARHLTVLRAMPGFATGSGGAILPVVDTHPDPSGSAITTLAFLKILVDDDVGGGAYGIRWRVGRRSVVRAVNFVNRQVDSVTPDQSRPFVLVSETGGGRWYEVFNTSYRNQVSGYRHVMVDGTTEPLRFYQLNPEHARPGAAPFGPDGPEPELEIRGASDVSIYGLKSEGNWAVAWISDSQRIFVSGTGGNMTAVPGASLFRLWRSTDFVLANAVHMPTQVDCTPTPQNDYVADCGACWSRFSGCSFDPKSWSMIHEETATGATVDTQASPTVHRPVVYLRGSP